MIHLTSCEIDELDYCQCELKRVLALLDAVGAGIAAIHVNAAIEQLNTNLRAIGKNSPAAHTHMLFPEDNG